MIAGHVKHQQSASLDATRRGCPDAKSAVLAPVSLIVPFERSLWRFILLITDMYKHPLTPPRHRLGAAWSRGAVPLSP
jgi:hypothetical protein